MRNRSILHPRVLRATVLASSMMMGAADAGSISVTDGWIRALPGDTPAGGYFNLANDSGKRIDLTGASSPACGMLMLHKTETMGGMAMMNDVKQIPLAAGAHLSFSPGGYHLMCMDPTAAIKPGNKVPVTLEFGDGTKVTADFTVRNAAGR